MKKFGHLSLPVRFAFAGCLVGIAAAIGITLVVGSGRTMWWWPAGTVTFAFAGFMGAFLIGEEVSGGRADDLDQAEALRARHEAGLPDSPWERH